MGRVPSGESKTVARLGLQYIRPYHREIARRLVLGEKGPSIQDSLGMTPARFSIVINSPLFKLEIARLERERDAGVADITKTLRDLSPIALEQIERTMYTTKSDGIRLRAAESILDRAGHGAINKTDIRATVNHNHVYGEMSDVELRRLAEERLRLASEAVTQQEKEFEEAKAIEVEFEEVEMGGDDNSHHEHNEPMSIEEKITREIMGEK